MPRVAIHTLGCKLNFAESSTIGRQFLEHGFDVVPFGMASDVTVINTCSVTAKANQECRQMIRRALRTSPESYVIVTGCYAQLAPDEVSRIEGVDLIAGTNEKFNLFTLAGDMQKLSCPAVHVSSIDAPLGFLPAATSEAGGRTRAYLKIQDGCDYSCTFCTIPKARGPSRSHSPEACLREAQGLVQEGFKEIVLTGVNVGDYGRNAAYSLGGLLGRLTTIDGLRRIRISSIEPNLLDDTLLEIIKGNPRICRHLHLPLQSGSNHILRAMRRRYTSQAYEHLVDRILRSIPGCTIGADVIVGFPGETEDRFNETYRFLADLPVTYLHVFTYSERPGTPAASMRDAVPPRVRSERTALLRSLSERKRSAQLQSLVGRKVEVLLESEEDEGLRFGLTDTYFRVGVPLAGTTDNTLVSALVEEMRGGYCRGSLVTAVA
jgi:threonylcarbamoyladenosine tRNA methylthiotransferase MtaB